MISLNDIPGRSAIDKLQIYDGINPYILKLKNTLIKDGKILLTENQIKYITSAYNVEPIFINRVINITEYFGKELQKKEELSFTPERILVEFILFDSEKFYHVYGKLTQKQKNSKMYWLPKTQVIDDPYFEEIKIDVDFTPYNDILAKQNKKLYKHQETGVKFLLSRNSCILADDMGVAKTLQAIVAALESGSERILIVCPSSLKINWEREIKVFCDDISVIDGKKWSTSKFTIINFDILKNFHTICKNEKSKGELVDTNFDCCIIDECFPYKTIVKTNIGPLFIGDIVEKNLDVKILSYNHNKDIFEYKPINRWIKLNKNKLYKLNLSDGTNLVCSENHKLFVKNKGYIKVKEINNDDELYKLLERNNEEKKLEESEILFKNMLSPNKEGYYFTEERKNPKNKNLRTLFKKLPCLWKFGKQKKKVLFNKMFSTMENVTTRNNEKLSKQRSKDKNEHKYEKSAPKQPTISQKKFRKDETKQSNVKYRISGKNEEKFNRSNVFKSWWKRSINKTTNYATKSYRNRMDNRTSNNNSNSETYVRISTKFLQSRLRKPEFNDSNRSRWKNTQVEKMEIFRQAKNGNLKQVRVESIEILESGNRKQLGGMYSEDKRVYNIEVKDNHNYFANDILVSNCHYLKNNKSIRGEIMVDLCINHNIPRVWLLTGTPLSNSPMDFFNLLKIIKSPIANNWKYYAKRYCDGKKFFKTLKNGKKKQIWLTDGASNLEELGFKTKNILLRRLKSDVLELPDKIITPIYHRLTNSELIQYNELWEKYLEKRLLDGKKNGNLQKDLVELILLRQFIANKAIPYTIELVENALNMGRKVIIFTNFTEELDILFEHFGKISVKHNGLMTDKQKQKSVDDFQNNPKVKVFIGNIKSAGVGITLTESTVTVFNSYDWVPASNEQCEDRSYRIGQVNDVNIFYQLFENTISTRMWETLKYKKDFINTILGDKKICEEEITNIIMDNLIDKNNIDIIKDEN